MPATSKNQAVAMEIAEHAPGKLYGRNRGMLKMSHQQLHDFASTKRKGLPKSKGKPAPKRTTIGGLMGAAEEEDEG